jgi:putative pyruvate formate lyase activating enzyme
MKYICNDCPRRCGALRDDDTPGGFCASPSMPRVARAAAHFGEEPCISGTKGSGAVFFTGCSLRCVFCQNHEISGVGGAGKAVTPEELREIFLRLRDTGVHNINLVTPTHFSRAIAEALSGLELGIPVVWNSSGYESAETLRSLEGLVQVYMPDFKYMDPALAAAYSSAPDYPGTAVAAIEEMYRQRGAFVIDSNGIAQNGVLIRHLIMPGRPENTKAVIDWVSGRFPRGEVLFSLMSQYTPMPGAARYPGLSRRVSRGENQRLRDYMLDCGIENGFWQETRSATEEMIPEFDLTGV